MEKRVYVLYEDFLKLKEEIEKERSRRIKSFEKANMLKLKRPMRRLNFQKSIEDMDKKIKDLEAYSNI